MEKSIWLLMVDPQADLRDLRLMHLNEYSSKHNLISFIFQMYHEGHSNNGLQTRKKDLRPSVAFVKN